MNKSYEELVETFNAKDSNGNIYQISCYQDVKEQSLLNGSVDVSRGMKSLRTSTSPVNRIDDNNYLIVITDTKVSKVS